MAGTGRTGVEQTVAALRDPTRRTILFSFYEHPGARTVDEVAAEAGVHRTVAFQHLERLVAFGYLTTDRRRGSRGKPAKLYRLAGGPIELTHPARLYRQLAGLLARALEKLGSAGRGASLEVGRDFGRLIGSGRRAGSPREALAPVTALGGNYVFLPDGALMAVNCIFREACEQAPQVVCGLHAGLLEGVLAAADQPYRVSALGPREPAACAYAIEAERVPMNSAEFEPR